jgi:glycine cleavage system aminomethyltransferase T
MMHDPEKSDLCILAVKSANKPEGAGAESMERRRRAKGNAEEASMHRTLGRVRMSPGLDRVRERAKSQRKERFTSLLHHIGKRSLALPENVRADRLQLIGLAGEGAAALPVGSHLRLADSQEATDGWVTSAGSLSSDGKPIAMAMLRAGRRQMNHVVTVHDGGRVVTRACVVTPLFYDADGARMHA